MSYVFDIDGVTVCSPALEVGDAYARSALGPAAALKIDPGFTRISEDMIEIDRGTFASFATRLAQVAATAGGQLVLVGLIEAVLPPLLVMLKRAGVALDLDGGARWAGRVNRLKGCRDDSSRSFDRVRWRRGPLPNLLCIYSNICTIDVSREGKVAASSRRSPRPRRVRFHK